MGSWRKDHTLTFRLRESELQKLELIRLELDVKKTYHWYKHSSLSDAIRHLILFYKIPASDPQV
jgi:hypothetical protein